MTDAAPAGGRSAYQDHLERAMAHQAKGRAEKAAQEFREALKLQPASPDVRSRLGIVLAELGRFEEAIGEFKTAIALNPSDAGARFRLAMLLAGQHRNAEAITAYQEFLRHCDAAHKNYAEFARQRIVELSKPGGGPEAKPAAEPDVAPPEGRSAYQDHLERAMAHRAKGRAEKAAQEFREALKLQPDSAAVHGHLGVILAELGRFDEAIGELQTAIAGNPSDAGARFRLAMLLAGQHRNAEAVTAYEEFLRHCDAAHKDHAQFARNRIAELSKPSPEPEVMPAKELEAEPAKELEAEPAKEPEATPAPPPAAPRTPSTVPRSPVRWALISGAAAIALAYGARGYGPAVWERYQRWRWPDSASADAGLAAPMLRDNAVRRLAESVHRYRRVAGALAAAEREGQDVAALRGRLKEAEALMQGNNPGYAMALLNVIELRIPRRAEDVRAAEKDDAGVESILKDRAHRRAPNGPGKRPQRAGRKPRK